MAALPDETEPAARRRPAAARAAFAFAAAAGRTFLDRQFAEYPFHVCRPFYLAGDPAGMATLYLQSCSGGIYEHDSLSLALSLAEGARAHVTSQASTIVHAMERGEAATSVRIEAGPHAFCEYLPDPLILFPQCRLRARLRLRLHETATAILADSFLMHDPAGAGRPFGHIESELLAETADGRGLALDRFEIAGEAFAAGLPGIAGAYRAQGSLLIVAPAPAAQLLAAVRAALEGIEGLYAGASLIRGEAGLWVRLLAADGVALRRGLSAAWAAGRAALTGLRPQPRRK